MEGQAQQNTEQNNSNIPTEEVEIISPISEEDNSNAQEQEEEIAIMTSVLDDLGLMEQFADIYQFDDDVDVDTPEGIKQVIQNTLVAGGKLFFEEKIKSNPDLYSVYLHLENGGDISSFRNEEIALPSLEELKNNVDLQVQQYKQFLTDNGHDKDEIEILVQNAIKNESIKDKALNYITKKIETRDSKNKEIENQIKEEKNQREQITSTAIHIISDLIRENSFSAGIRLNTDSKKQEFFNSLSQNLIYDGGLIYYNVPISDDNIKDIMEQHYLLNNKEAKTKFYGANKAKNTEGLSLKNKNQKNPVTSNSPVQPEEDKISASDFIGRMGRVL